MYEGEEKYAQGYLKHPCTTISGSVSSSGDLVRGGI